jgi:hypothetical protein
MFPSFELIVAAVVGVPMVMYGIGIASAQMSGWTRMAERWPGPASASVPVTRSFGRVANFRLAKRRLGVGFDAESVHLRSVAMFGFPPLRIPRSAIRDIRPVTGIFAERVEVTLEDGFSFEVEAQLWTPPWA